MWLCAVKKLLTRLSLMYSRPSDAAGFESVDCEVSNGKCLTQSPLR